MMKRKTLLSKVMLLLCILTAGVSNAWAQTEKTGSYTFGNSSVSGWTCSPQSTYCGLYYSGKNSDFTVTNKSIANFSDVDFSAVSSASVTITVKGITNSGTNSYTVSLVDKDGNVVGTPQTKTNGLKNSSNSSEAQESSVTLTPVVGATGYKISCKAKTALAGTSYVLTYTMDSRAASTVVVTPSEKEFNLADGLSYTLSATVKTGDSPIDKVVTWSSSNTDVANVNASTGEVTPVSAGTASIKASFAGDVDYRASEGACVVTVNKANTTLTLDKTEGAIDLKNIGARIVNLTPTVKATKSDDSQVAVVSPNVIWSSSDETVATVVDGVVTGHKVGTATITAHYAGGANYNAATDATCEITVSDTRTAVNVETFSSAKTTLVIGDEQTTSVTNDQAGWTSAYTYASSNGSVATVDADGKITALAKGTATITVTLNVDADDANYKAGTTTSKTIDITVTKQFHTVTFSVNGDVTRTASVEEDQKITFPTAVETTPADATEFPKVINGMYFVGWYSSTYSNSTEAPAYVNAASTNMGDGDVVYYAVYAEKEESESDELSDAVIGQSLQYDTWTYSGSTTNKSSSSYRLFHSGSYVQSATFDLSKLMKVIVYGGTFGGGSYNSLTIGDGTNVWKNVTVSGSSETGKNTYSGGSALSGMGTLRIISNSGTSSSSGVRISKIEIYVKGSIVTYKYYNTTVSDLPRPEITMADVEMVWGDTDKSVAPSATVSGSPYDGSFIFESSDANLTVASDGKLTCNIPGTYTVTAKIAATGSYQAAEMTCNVIVNKQNATISFAEATVQKLDSDGSYAQTATKTPAGAGDITYSISPSGNTINSSNGTVTLTETGNYTVTATSAENDLYNESTGYYTLQIRTVPTITVTTDKTMAIGESYTPSIAGGDVTITSDPAGMITVDGNKITAAAVGTATITVATAANDTYIAGEETFNLTVTAPEGLTETPTPEPVVIFNETFNSYTGIKGGNDGDFKNGSGTFAIASNDESGWSVENAYAALQCVRMGTGSSLGKATTRALNTEGTLSLSFKAAAWNNASENTTLKISVNKGTLSANTVTMSKTQWTSYNITITGAKEDTKITFEGNSSSGSRFFLDEVKVSRPGDGVESVSATIAASGYGSYCCEYPLNLPADNDDYKAYIVTKVDGKNVTFTQISGEIKGGVPFILYGNAGSYELPTAASSDVVPAGNLLKGTLAPTYISTVEGDYTNFGLNAGSFKKINNGVLPAHKAYLPIETSKLPAGEARMSIVFEDAETTGINNVNVNHNDNCYDLQGRKVNAPKKGLYIVNGKKMFIK